MTATALRPDVAGLVREGDWAVLGDCLLDHDFSPAEVALLYAGTPPDHQDGLAEGALAAYLEQEGRPAEAALVRGYNDHWLWGEATLVLTWREGRQPGGPRRGMSERQRACWTALVCGTPLARGEPEPGAVSAAGEARRRRKARALALPWAEGAVVTFEAAVPRDDWVLEGFPRGDFHGVMTAGRPAAAVSEVVRLLQAAGLRLGPWAGRPAPAVHAAHDLAGRRVLVRQDVPASRLVATEDRVRD